MRTVQLMRKELQSSWKTNGTEPGLPSEQRKELCRLLKDDTSVQSSTVEWCRNYFLSLVCIDPESGKMQVDWVNGERKLHFKICGSDKFLHISSAPMVYEEFKSDMVEQDAITTPSLSTFARCFALTHFQQLPVLANVPAS